MRQAGVDERPLPHRATTGTCRRSGGTSTGSRIDPVARNGGAARLAPGPTRRGRQAARPTGSAASWPNTGWGRPRPARTRVPVPGRHRGRPRGTAGEPAGRAAGPGGRGPPGRRSRCNWKLDADLTARLPRGGDGPQPEVAIDGLNRILAVKPDLGGRPLEARDPARRAPGRLDRAIPHLEAVVDARPGQRDRASPCSAGWPTSATGRTRRPPTTNGPSGIEPFDAKINYHWGLALLKLRTGGPTPRAGSARRSRWTRTTPGPSRGWPTHCGNRAARPTPSGRRGGRRSSPPSASRTCS